MSNKILKREFFERNTLDVSQDLLGHFLVRKIGKKTVRARITETEAYIGEDDLACHARAGRTKRTEIMYGKAGHAYIYLIYGMYELLNIVTEKEGYPAGILIRAVEIDGVPKKRTNGPGKLCRELLIDRKLNGHDATKKGELWLEEGKRTWGEKISATSRVGVEYAGACAEYPWRFVLAE